MTGGRKVSGSERRIAWRAARALGSVPAPVYALSYVGVMLTFAILYYWLVPRGFYHPTAQFEPSLAAEAVSIQREIRASMIGAIAGGSDSGRVWLGEWRIDTSAVTIDSFAPNSVGFEFSLQAYAIKQIPRGEALSIVSAPVSVSLVSSSDRFTVFQRKEWLYLPVEAVLLDSELRGGLSDSEIRAKLFPEHPSDAAWKREVNMSGSLAGFLRCRPSLRRRMVALVDGMRGFPSRVPGSFWRMLYISASVMTSTTFGDVVPVTASARGFVTLEAVLSVLIVGLFINSIAHYIRRTD